MRYIVLYIDNTKTSGKDQYYVPIDFNKNGTPSSAFFVDGLEFGPGTFGL